MHKYILAPIIGFNKAEAFTLIEKFDTTCWHSDMIKVGSRKLEVVNLPNRVIEWSAPAIVFAYKAGSLEKVKVGPILSEKIAKAGFAAKFAIN